MKAIFPSQALFRLEGHTLSEIIAVNTKISFDDLTHLVSYVTQTPIAFISFFDPTHHWLKSQIGFQSAPSVYLDFCDQAIYFKQQISIVQTPNNPSNRSSQTANLWPFFDHLSPSPDPILIADILTNPQLASHPLVRGEGSIRFYGGLPLLSAKGQILGLISIMDLTPRTLTEEMLSGWAALGRQIINQIESQRQVINLSRKFNQLETLITQRQEIWKIVRQERDFVCAVLDTISGLVIVVDSQGKIIRFNRTCEQLTGYSADTVEGHTLEEFGFSIFEVEISEEISRKNGRSLCHTWETLWTFQDGSKHWIAWSNRVLFNDLGEPDSIIATGIDITERKQGEVALLERSQLLMLEAEVGVALGHGKSILSILDQCVEAIAKFLEGTGVAIWLFNSRTQKFNLQAVAGQPLPQTWTSRKVQTQNSLYKILQQPLSQKTNVALKLPLRVDERLLGMMAIFSSHPLTEIVQEGLGWVANSLAIAIDRVQVRQELQSRREALLFRLASQIRDSLDIDTILGKAVHEIRTLLQIDQCLFLWCMPMQSQKECFCITHEAISPTLSQRIQEYPVDQINWLAEKIRVHETVQIDDLEEITEFDLPTWEFLTQGRVTSALFLPLETRSGQRGAVACNHYSGPRSWSSSEVELLQGVVDQLAIAIDQAELYAQTRAAALAAQTQAFHLTEALQDLQQKEAQLIQSEKMSSLGQMVAGVAHEINNPVNFIYGNLTYAKDYIQDLLELIELYQTYYPQPVSEIQEKATEMELDFLIEDLPKILSSMEMGADRIRQIVVSLRNFSRLDEADMKPVDIHEGIDSTLLILQNRLKPKGSNTGISIVKNYGSLPKVECYAGQLNQVFMNLLSNGIDALEDQPEPRIISIETDVFHPNLTLSSHPLHRLDQVRIKIRDNGKGIDETVKNRLFDPFFTTKPVGKGTGLGLSISYKIVVEQHQGKILCYRDEEGYTVFEVCIPIHQRG